MFASYFVHSLACLLACLLAFLMHLLMLLLCFVDFFLVCVRRLVSHETVATVETSKVKYKRTCAVINTWLFVVLSLYVELVIFSP